MWPFSHQWLASALLVVLAGLFAAPLLRAGPPGPPAPSAAGGAGRGSLSTPGLPTTPAGVTAIARQGDLLRFRRNLPGDAKPILVEADEIATWNENGLVVLLLRGQVLVQQGVAHCRFREGVAWVDMKRSLTSGIVHMDLYAEGQVRLDTSTENQDGGRAVLDLNTHGEFRVRVHRDKVVRQDRSTDPLVARARALGLHPLPVAATPKSATPIVPVSGSAPGSIPPRPGDGAGPSLPSGGAILPIPTAPPAGGFPPPAPGAGTAPAPPVGGAPPGGSGVRQTAFDSPAPGTSPASGVTQAQAILPGPALAPPTTSPSPSPPLPPAPIPATPAPKPNLPADPPPQQPNTPPKPSSPDPGPDSPAPPAPETPVPSRSEQQPAPPVPPRPPVPPTSTPAAPGRPGLVTSGLPRQYRILPRSGTPFQVTDEEPNHDGRHIITITGGVILSVRNAGTIGTLDVEADRAVIWLKNKTASANPTSLQGESSSELEFYMEGHVVLRIHKSGSKDREDVLCEQMYYDTSRNVMVALKSRLELRTERFLAKAPQTKEPFVVVSDELFRTSETTYEINRSVVFSSLLQSDPGLTIHIADAVIEDRKRPVTNLFGRPVIDPKTGRQAEIDQSIVTAHNAIAELEGIPFFYTPYYKGNARDPLGPLEAIDAGASNIYGVQIGVGLNVYKLLGLLQPDGVHWRLNLDYLSLRGPAGGTDLDYGGNLGVPGLPGSVDPLGLISVFGVSREDPKDPDTPPTSYVGLVRSYLIYDQHVDNLGVRPFELVPFIPPGVRGRFLWRNALWDLPYGFNLQTQIAYLSDRNFYEQYFKNDFDSDPNQNDYVYLKEQRDNWAWAALVQPRLGKPWITETEWLPRLDGYLIGQPIIDRLTSDTWVDLAYARFRPSSDPHQLLVDPAGLPIPGAFIPPIHFPTSTVPVDTGRFSIMEELAYPVTLGPFKVMPYLKGAATEYTSDLTGNEVGRLWGGGGLRASIPFTRLYPDVQSDLFNVQGINHKLVLSGNYFYANTNVHYTRLPELDRLEDDASEQMLREFTPSQPFYNPGAGLALAADRLFDPQMFAIRTLIDNRLETLDHIDVLQVDLRQRWQTKRGYPGAEHIIDWMVLDTSFSYFPEPSKDNFGKPFAFLQYDWLWNIGDQTSLESTGWYDPEQFGPRVFTFGIHFDRPDHTQFFLGYRQIDPLMSKAMTASVTYVFSPKYSMTFTTTYDFGVQTSMNNSIVFTRTGPDLKVSLGLTYNPLQSNVGAVVMIVPTLAPVQTTGLGSTPMQ
jgi:hypothetical protein